MAGKSNRGPNFDRWAEATGVPLEELKSAWRELLRRGLVSAKYGRVTTSPLAMRRASTDAERRLASHLSGYVLTESSFIVRRAGDPAGSACVLNTRIAVEQIATYFRDGWGVTEIEQDLNVLTSAEIEAAIQYYLNHRAEIERDLKRGQEMYESNAPREEPVAV